MSLKVKYSDFAAAANAVSEASQLFWNANPNGGKYDLVMFHRNVGWKSATARETLVKKVGRIGT